jgi:hypothetical protein
MVPDDPPASRPPGRPEGAEPVEPAEPAGASSPSTGRFQVAHRGGTRVEIGEALLVGGPRPWMCAVKLLGRRREEPAGDGEASQTLLVRVGRGMTADDARRDAMAQLTLVYGSPVEPAPDPVIVRKASDPPPRPPERGAPVRALRTWLSRLLGRLRR